MPSSSARCSQLPRAIDKVPFYEALKKFRDHLNGKMPDLQESEITFPDVFLKTAVKKEPKEENAEIYPGEMPDSSSDQLSQFTQGTYQLIPHEMSGNSSTSMPPGSLPNISGNLTSQAGSIPPTSQGPVLIKQEPVDPGYQSASSKSETMSLGQFEVYSQAGNGSQNDSHLNNFLNGLYGLVDQVAHGNKSQSKYGMVSQAGFSKNGPVQFNDALRDIVRDEEAEFESLSQGTEKPQAVASPPKPEVEKKSGKAGKQRKRKSKSKDEAIDMQSSPVSTAGPVTTYQSPDQHFIPMSSSSSSMVPSHSSSSLSQQAQSTLPQMSTMPPFTSNMQFNNYPMTTYDNMVYSNPPFTSQMPLGFPPTCQGYTTAQGFSGMMPNYPGPYMGFPGQHGPIPGYPYSMAPANFSGAPPMPGQPGLDPNVQVKQEKPDQ